MDGAIAILGGAGVSILIFQALRLLVSRDRKPYQTWTALLTLAIAAVIVLNDYLWSRQFLVSDTYTDLLLTQADAHYWLRTLVFAYPVIASLVVLAAASARSPAFRPFWMLVGGVLVGLHSASTVSLLRPEGGPSVVYAFDLFSPCLILWITGCVTFWTLTILGLRGRLLRNALSLLTCVGVAAWTASERLVVSSGLAEKSPWAPLTWDEAYWISAALAGVSALRALLEIVRPPKRPWLRELLYGLPAVPILAFLVGRSRWHGEIALAARMPGIALIVAALLLIVVAKIKLSDETIFRRDESGFARGVLCVSLAAMLALAIDLFFLQEIPPRYNLLGATIASIVMVELTSEGPLQSLRTLVANSELLPRIRSAVQRAWTHARKVTVRCREAVARRPYLSLFGGAFALMVVMLVSDEWQNRGRTVVEAFEVYGEPETTHTGRRFAELVVHRLNGIMLDLDDDMLVALPAGLQGNQSDGKTPLRVASVHTSEMAAELSSNSIDLGPLGKVPIGKLVKPLQRPLRRLLGIRYIEGSLVREGNGHRMLAHSSDGKSWTDPYREAEPVALALLAERLSFSILTTEKDWTERGMTTDREAFDHFLDATYNLEVRARLAGNDGTAAATAEAIEHLRGAVAKDPSFAVAHYRLALALQDEKQFGGALEHLRKVVRMRPTFGIAQNALATLVLHRVEGKQPMIVRALARRLHPKPDEVALTPINEAQLRWTKMIEHDASKWMPQHRAAAHQGLCALAAARRDRESLGEATFHCRIAAALYASLPDDQLAEMDRNDLRAHALNALGVAHLSYQRDEQPLEHLKLDPLVKRNPVVERNRLGCSDLQFDTKGESVARSWLVPPQGNHEAAVELFRSAHEIAPDDAVIACNQALAERASDAHSPMLDERASDPQTLAGLCRDTLGVAVDNPTNLAFEATLTVCDEALARDPDNIELLTQYASAVRLWWIMMSNAADPSPVPEQHVEKAEHRARLAVQRAIKSSIEGQRAAVKSTLGEVLLVRGRPREALSWLKQAAEEAPDHVGYGQIRHDLAEAYVCASAADRRPGSVLYGTSCYGSTDQAREALGDIGEFERALESPLYTASEELLDVSVLETLCHGAKKGGPEAPHERWEPTRTYASGPDACGPHPVRVTGAIDRASVRVSGPGLDVTGTAKNFRLELQPGADPGEYFIQLFDEHGRSLSGCLPLDTRGPRAHGEDCTLAPDATITLRFDANESVPRATARHGIPGPQASASYTNHP